MLAAATVRVSEPNDIGAPGSYEHSLTAVLANLVCKKADVDLKKRAGELTSEELERIVTIIQNPTAYKIPSVRYIYTLLPCTPPLLPSLSRASGVLTVWL